MFLGIWRIDLPRFHQKLFLGPKMVLNECFKVAERICDQLGRTCGKSMEQEIGPLGEEPVLLIDGGYVCSKCGIPFNHLMSPGRKLESAKGRLCRYTASPDGYERSRVSAAAQLIFLKNASI